MRSCVDVVLLVAAVAFGIGVQQDLLFADGLAHLPRAGAADIVAGVVCLSTVLWLRRRTPVAFTLVGVAASFVTTIAGAVPLIGVFTVASRRSRRVAVMTSAVVVLNAGLAQPLVHPLPHPLTTAAGGVLLALAATGWGMFAGSRRQVLELLREQVDAARRAEAEQEERTRTDERLRIAREMHDTLAHRLSLLAVHGGALAYRAGDAGPEVVDLAETVHEQARRALDDLRGAVGVLRADGRVPAPTPTAEHLPDLVAEASAGGLSVHLEQSGTVDGSVGTIVYRVVQESLTNSRRYGHGRPVSVVVTATDDVTVAITERGPADPSTLPDAPGAGTGLVGLAERVGLAGGTFEAGPGPDGAFRVRAVVPR